MELQDYISALLTKHNCVIVPNFGGFVANYKSAVIEKYRGKIHPPSKSVLFNSKLINNDGLLGNYVAAQKSLSYPDALELISAKISIWKNELNDGERIEIGEIGFLYSKNGQVHFEQSRETNLLLKAYGLRTLDFVDFSEKLQPKSVVAAKPVIEKPSYATDPIEKIEAVHLVTKEQKTVAKIKPHQKEVPADINLKEKETTVIALDSQKEIESVAPLEQDEQVIPIGRNRFGTAMKYAVAVCFVPVLFYSYWIPMETDALHTKTVQFSDFNPIHTQTKKVYELRTNDVVFEENVIAENWDILTENIDSETYSFEMTEDFYVSVNLEKQIIATEVDKTDVEEVFTEVEQSGSFHVISGCFSVQNNANNLVSDLKSNGFSSRILDKSGGLHRVSAGSFNTKSEAEAALDKVKSNGFSAWILSN